MSAIFSARLPERPQPDDNPEMRTVPASPRVLYSYPSKLGATRICYTAWQSVANVATAGAEVLVFPGVLQRPLPEFVRVRPTLARGKIRLPYKVLGTIPTFKLHDHIVAKRLRKLAGQIDVVHTWPVG